MTEALAAARARLGARQALLAVYLADEAVEARTRAAPGEVAHDWGVPVEFACWLAALDPRRVEAFRRTQRKKRSHDAGVHEGAG